MQIDYVKDREVCVHVGSKCLLRLVCAVLTFLWYSDASACWSGPANLDTYNWITNAGWSGSLNMNANMQFMDTVLLFSSILILTATCCSSPLKWSQMDRCDTRQACTSLDMTFGILEAHNGLTLDMMSQTAIKHEARCYFLSITYSSALKLY